LRFADTINAGAEKTLIVQRRTINGRIDASAGNAGVDRAGIAVVTTDRAAAAVGGVSLKVGVDDIAMGLMGWYGVDADRDKYDWIRGGAGKVTDADLVGGICAR